MPKALTPYFFPSLLILSILLGGVTGYLLGPRAAYLKPLGNIFLNLIFTAIVPLIFFSVSSAIARMNSLEKLGKIIFNMAIVFLFTGLVAAIYMLLIVKLFPPMQNISVSLIASEKIASPTLSDQIVNIFTVPDFAKLLLHENMLALIVFSILLGFSAATVGEKGKLFIEFLHSGEKIFMRIFSLIMYYAPIGFFAYFAVIVSELGPQIIGSYLRVTIIYYTAALIYFIFALTAYAYFAGKMEGIKLFWKNIFLPATTSLATCSSAASIPANLVAARAMGIPSQVYETTIPLGAIIHKDGSVMGGMIKIAFLFGLFHLSFSGLPILLMACCVSLMVGTVMGAIPSGGMLGELLILNVYGFPPSALIVIAAISIIIDPPATMLNVTSNTVSSMLIARFVGKKISSHKIL